MQPASTQVAPSKSDKPEPLAKIELDALQNH